jgi:hypothetical protein
VCKVIHPLLKSSDSLEFSPTNSLEDEGKLFVHNVYTSVTKLSLAERLVLLYLRGAMVGNVIAVRGKGTSSCVG